MCPSKRYHAAITSTRSDQVALCGDHGWHDWYLAANLADDALSSCHRVVGLEPTGVSRGLTGTMHPFNYSNTDQFNHIVDQYGSQLAAIVMEPTRTLLLRRGVRHDARSGDDPRAARRARQRDKSRRFINT